jgi:hypothetical protein
MKIYVPSKGRHSPEEIRRGPLADFSPRWLVQSVLVVPESEHEAYRSSLAETPFSGVDVLSPVGDVRGIAQTRHWIGKHAKFRDEKMFCMVDDDVRFVRRRSRDVTSLVPCEKSDVDDMWAHVNWFLHHYAHVGVSARQGNNNMGPGTPQGLFEENTRTLRVLCYRTEEFLSVAHGRVDVMEDFDVNLQLIRAGHKNANLGFWSQDQKMTNAPGGCSTYRSHEVHEASAKKLAELHHPFVQLRQKQNKTGGEFGSRTEVTIYWKKAFGTGRN